MINTIQSKYEGLLTPPFLAKRDDPRVPTIECLINQKVFHKTFCDIGSGVNIMSKVTYEYLFGKEPLHPTYMQLQMADESVRFSEAIAKDVIVQIQDHYVPTDFMVLDMGVEYEETLIILGRPFLNTTNTVIYIGSGQVHFQFLDRKIRYHFNSYTNYEQPKKNRNRRRHRSSCQATQPMKDGWANYSGEVSRYEDRWNEWDTQDKKIEEPINKEAT
jgi:hypothetical protein